MKLVGYVRVSSDSQEDNTSLPEQRKRIAAYCETYAHTLVEVFEDVASGKDLERDGINAALEALEGADGLIVFKLDRLSRSMRHTLALVEDTFIRTGKTLVSVSEQIDTATPAGRMFLSMMGAFAQYERELINERTQGGRAAKAAKGGYAYGAPRYGFRAVDGELVPHLDEQNVIALMTRHRRSGKSFAAIASYLNEREIPTKTGKGLWSATQVINVLRA